MSWVAAGRLPRQGVAGSLLLIQRPCASVNSPLDRLLDNLPAGSPPPASADLQRTIGLFNRMASYLDKTRSV